MRVWKFFKKPKEGEEIPDSVKLEDKYPLYAMTNDEQLAEDFKRIHNMHRFVVRVMKGVSREEYKRYGNTFRSTILKYAKLMTQDEGRRTYIEVPMTEMEDTNIQEPYIESFNDENFWDLIPINPGLFGKKYIQALKTIQFLKMYSVTQGIPLDDDEDDYSVPEIIVDELHLYFDIYADILL